MAQSKDGSSGSSRAIWGDGRITYAVFAEKIRELVALEWSIRKIHEHLNLASTGLTYQQLAYYLKKEQIKTRLKEKAETSKLDTKASEPGKKFRPGPRLPNPKEIY